MIEIMEDMPDKVLAIRASGVVKQEDYDKVLIPAIEDKKEKYGKVRFLYYLDEDFESFSGKAILEDAKAVTQYFTSFEKIAVVSDVDWINSAVEIFKYVIPGPVRTYSIEELPKAKVWIND
ncbi:STAS/SEC14 domain-containing protein [Methanolobus zinderi]|uniref:STAS/SEC14 domain-containing protein n=1 Tax=Methanolobus zinderi TaxID=536044 RepID=A0A7D5I4U9_9EURY|nr:STAS/SEC14 domain-containing protein [Methanolobus zinderi]QLC49801.1 STAS/SEC14 domain-containing protein [Methanolobus zinderi]